MTHPATARPSLAALSATALLYMAVVQAMDTPLQGQSDTHLLHPGPGLALALWIWGGARLAPGLWAGALLGAALAGQSPWAALAEAMGSLVAAGVASHYLQRRSSFDRDHPNFHVVRHVLLGACGLGAGVGALVASGMLLLVGEVPLRHGLPHAMEWWMGASLGMLLFSPLVLGYRRALKSPQPLRRVKEGLAVWLGAGIAGVLIFGNPQNERIAAIANAYWMFLFVSWAGARLGLLPTMGLVSLVGLQALWGTYQGTGFFASDLATTHGFGYWSYMMILGTAGLSLSAYMAERALQTTGLRIAATAFECQEGMLITNRDGLILQANQALLRLTGYELSEVLGRTPHFLCAAGHEARPADLAAAFTPRRNVQRRTRIARKSGESFPAWVTVTPVADPNGHVSHFVISMSDITDLQELEQRRREQERAKRDTLVREVHHRIKNNLQGIIGMLRALDHQHPALHGPINQMVDQIHSIAAIHGLQASRTSEEVRLCELTRTVAEGVAHNWNTPIHVDIPSPWRPCRLSNQEAVPVALVLNELIVNAVKHGGQAHQDVRIRLRKGQDEEHVEITLSNPGRWPAPHPPTPATGRGLDLVQALLPRSGASITRSQAADRAVVHLVLSPPVIHAESTHHDL
ncbi:PAS domain S-box protein [Acidovorax sp. 210-6]|uniref:PAS domain S-box protein n=1 Tax=Acidovorax sp. 210-6 TaxID=2699468 RepID=UPI00138A32E9|nr:PAS domain S-box protein [Acidovorax sp. 210-6]NCU67676.1 PAS domain S-box protein [Acidovorax sp. 210-6]